MGDGQQAGARRKALMGEASRGSCLVPGQRQQLLGTSGAAVQQWYQIGAPLPGQVREDFSETEGVARSKKFPGCLGIGRRDAVGTGLEMRKEMVQV